ncbi:rab guanine nucleotide exchange factor S2 [Onygenales sp. PD_12]|nr:rab guanine nucleotide exchange factor S2 [Onygenales sp. PD_12]
MAELISIHGWGYPTLRAVSASSDPVQKLRPNSSDSRSVSPNKRILKAKSTNALSDMAAGSGRVNVPPSVLEGPSENSLSTLRDPRVASTSDLSSTASSPHHPDLSNEVATLSDKLIQAINNQTILDDTLAATRQELEASRNRVQQLEKANTQHEADVANGVLVRKADVDGEISKLKDEAAEQRAQRAAIEKQKKTIELELENLTAALFEEANKMVAAAQKQRDSVEKRNEQLRAQLKDTEMLLASQQEQLTELKSVMQQMNSDHEELLSRTDASTAPPSPAAVNQSANNINRLLEAMNLSPVTPGSGDISPAPSTSFSHLIKSVSRTDIQAYEDFHSMLQQSKTSKPSSRVPSGSYGGLNVMSLGGITGNRESQHNHSHSNGSGWSITGLPGSPGSNASPREPHVVLKETRFYKRALTEDIEPTLRLDAAPGISWLTRRTVLSSICDGNLIVEPMSEMVVKFAPPCALCGESRKGEENIRTHRFRTSDNENAQRYPLCMICLEKVKSCCDFVGYLKLIVDGQIQISDEEDEKESWQETIRLRERMFWSRIGGGVVPTFIQKEQSIRSPDSPCRKCEEDPKAADDPFVTDLKEVPNGISVTEPSDEPQTQGPEGKTRKESEAVVEVNPTTDLPGGAENQPPSTTTEPLDESADTKTLAPNESDAVRPVTPGSGVGSDSKLKVTIPQTPEL